MVKNFEQNWIFCVKNKVTLDARTIHEHFWTFHKCYSAVSKAFSIVCGPFKTRKAQKRSRTVNAQGRCTVWNACNITLTFINKRNTLPYFFNMILPTLIMYTMNVSNPLLFRNALERIVETLTLTCQKYCINFTIMDINERVQLLSKQAKIICLN